MKKEQIGRIYVIKNKINEKEYIGQTVQTIKTRFNGHKHEALTKNKGTAIGNSIRKYGIENFYIELLEDNILYEDLDDKEIHYIKEHNTVTPNGYNISHGGQAYRTEEEKQRMSDRVKGSKNPMYGSYGELNPFYKQKHTDETIAILKEKGAEHWNSKTDEEKELEISRLKEICLEYISENGGAFSGHHHSEKSKKQISDKLKGKVFSKEHNAKISENHANKQKVVMLEKNTGKYLNEFDSMTKACIWLKENGIHSKAKSGEISNVCRKTRKTAYGFVWVYYEDYIKGNYNAKVRRKGGKIICLTTNEIFESAKYALEKYDISKSGLSSCCTKRQRTCGKLEDGTVLEWMYYEEYLELNKI